MKTLFNVDHLPVVLENDAPAIEPGASYDFTDEQVEAGIAGVWSEDDPRGPARQTKPAAPVVTQQTTAPATPMALGQSTEPAEPEKE